MAFTHTTAPSFARFGGLLAVLAIGAVGCTAQVGDDDIVSAAEGLRFDRACLADRLAAADADPAERRRIRDARPDCFVDDGDPATRDRRDHCDEVRLLARRVWDNPRHLRRLANAYPECFGGGDEGDTRDECAALRQRAAESRDPAEARAWLARYFDCVDDRDRRDGGDPGPDIACTDGTRPLCRALPPECARDEVLAVRDSCWACVPADACRPDPTDRCLELRRLASEAYRAGDRARFRYYSDAYRRCVAAGMSGPEPVDPPTCGELRLAAERARDAGDEDRFRYYTAAYLACIEGDRPSDRECSDLREAAARAEAAGDEPLFRRYYAAYLECVDGHDGPPDVSCDVVLCAPNTHCVETDRGPICIPDDCVRETDERGAEIVRCPSDPPPSDCPRIYEPVCGADGVTYDNSCLAREAGATPVTDGPCRR